MRDYRELMQAFREETASAPAPVAQPRRWPVPVGLAAAAAVAVVAGVVGWPETPVSGTLRTGPLTGEVTLEVDGTGHARGRERAMVLSWEAGRLEVEVEPDQGVQLVVETDEARVEVVGTGFGVLRDALGTRVDVRHGRVRVMCEGEHQLGAGESYTCLPKSAAGRLGRLRALQGARESAVGDLLLEVKAALSLPDATGLTAQELRSVQLDLLVGEGSPEALPLAEALAAEGGPRATELHRVAARLRLREGPDCAGALPHLQALAAADALGEDAPWLGTCTEAAGR